MIVDLNVGGVLVPGLVVLAFIALIATMAVLRLFAVTGLNRLELRAPVELRALKPAK